ncbi:universal stress protein [Georgenia sp. Z1491]|uniref:universal stress protein n=1 Tax=Georgenia sp. Z1491 TaxID=3416707 RepID=UPI003CF7FDB6
MSIVVGYVPTPEGRSALRRAAAEAKLRQSKLIVVNSQHGGRTWDPEESVRFEDDLARVRTELEAEGVDHELRTLIRGQDPADDLVEVASQENADFIVIGLRRRSQVGKLLLGSNAQQILMKADVPVLAVKGAPTD